MNGTATLAQRVTAVLKAKQYLVFFSIGLYALDFGMPLLAAWLYRHRPIATLLDEARGPLADAVAGASGLIATLFIVYLLVSTWFRAGYIRSIVGRFHLGPQGSRQFLRLLVFELLIEAAVATAAGLMTLDGATPVLAVLLLFGGYLAVLYADYIIVISDSGPLRAIGLSVRTLRANLTVSVLALLVVTALGDAAVLLDRAVTSGLLQALPLLVVRVILMGAVLFVADVTLVVVYITTLERGALTARRRASSSG